MAALGRITVEGIRNEGQRMLLTVPGSLAAIATEIGVKAPQVVHQWKIGAKRPAAPLRARLHTAYGIPPAAWDETPEQPHQRARRGALASAPPPPPEPAAVAPAGPDPTSLDDCLA